MTWYCSILYVIIYISQGDHPSCTFSFAHNSLCYIREFALSFSVGLAKKVIPAAIVALFRNFE